MLCLATLFPPSLIITSTCRAYQYIQSWAPIGNILGGVKIKKFSNVRQ
jgi:hypothetical protein